jgi:hypothetical protein
MFKSLLRFFGLVNGKSDTDNFDPLYGLPKQSLDEWLSRNPTLKREYASELAARFWRSHRRGCSGSRRNHTVVC